MTYRSEIPQVSNDDWIALAAFLDRGDAARCVHEVEAIGYMLAYARQTAAEVLALPSGGGPGFYRLLFSFTSPDNLVDFLRLLHLNEVTAQVEIDVPAAREIREARPFPAVLPVDVVPQIVQFADVLLSYHDRPQAMG